MVKILIANGVNLDLLGQRQVDIYGRATLNDLQETLQNEAKQLSTWTGTPVELDFFQSNHEGVWLDRLTEPWDGAIINPGAWTHTSLALGDRLASINRPYIEVHLSNLSRREPFRRKSYSAPYALGVVYGFGLGSYTTALYGLLRHLTKTSI